MEQIHVEAVCHSGTNNDQIDDEEISTDSDKAILESHVKAFAEPETFTETLKRKHSILSPANLNDSNDDDATLDERLKSLRKGSEVPSCNEFQCLEGKSEISQNVTRQLVHGCDDSSIDSTNAVPGNLE
ncbi:hypothetical protein QAD02_011966 [Eretmocerus hayati]|uniref:Uncharacterized protein n=1 Tax=Eretmocerus hayati TaxID=131215 RepID=A0ACC2NY12_9HYME|nr:hypothetical protein QAD02_011966 [Eretmocerus hayati]